MSSRFGRNQRRRARAVEAELARTQLALGQAATGLYAVGDPSRGYPALSSLGTIGAFDIHDGVNYRFIKKEAEVTLTIYEYRKLDQIVTSAYNPIVAWRGILWQIVSTGRLEDGPYIGGPPQIELKLAAVGFKGSAEDVMPMTAERWDDLKGEVLTA